MDRLVLLNRILLLAGIAFSALAACMPRVKTPVDTIAYPGLNGDKECLVVLLPGRGDRVEVFERVGFISAARDAGLDADITAADLHIGYYYERNAMLRLHEDVIIPAQRAGYGQIWLVGISMGGMGALFHERDYPGHITGMVLMAPFLGEDQIIDEIAQAGGVLAWEPGPVHEDDYQRVLWSWIQQYAREGQEKAPIILAYGTGDRLAASNSLFAGVLPPGSVYTAEGGHTWGTWLGLWERLLAEGVLCSGRTP